MSRPRKDSALVTSLRALRESGQLATAMQLVAAPKRKKNPAAVSLGKRGRAVNSEAQQEAARTNGKLGGRPKKRKEGQP